MPTRRQIQRSVNRDNPRKVVIPRPTSGRTHYDDYAGSAAAWHPTDQLGIIYYGAVDNVVLSGDTTKVLTLTDQTTPQYDMVAPAEVNAPAWTAVDAEVGGGPSMQNGPGTDTRFTLPATALPVTIVVLSKMRYTSSHAQMLRDQTGLENSLYVKVRTIADQGFLDAGPIININGADGVNWHVPLDVVLSAANEDSNSWHLLGFEFTATDLTFLRDGVAVKTGAGVFTVGISGNELRLGTQFDFEFTDFGVVAGVLDAADWANWIAYMNTNRGLTL